MKDKPENPKIPNPNYPHLGGKCDLCGKDVYYETQHEASAPGTHRHESCDDEEWQKAEDEMMSEVKHYSGPPFTLNDLLKLQREKASIHSRSACNKGGCGQCSEIVSDR